MAYQLNEINARVRRDSAGFLAECDAVYEQNIRNAAGKILDNLKKSPIVLLSGPSGSGKTTTALNIQAELRQRGVNTHAVSLDDYFLSQVDRDMPLTPSGEPDWESPLILDIELLDLHFAALANGAPVAVPRFDFSRQIRDETAHTPLHLGKDEVVVFEGIHALNPAIAGRHSEAFRLYVSARSDVLDGGALRFKGTWMRLVRRAVRDKNFRGMDMSRTLGIWANVRRGEKAYISPYKNTAHVMFDSSLPYEVPVMKRYAAPLLEAIPTRNVRRAELLDLIRAFDWFETIDPALVSRTSLLREFIGGGIY